jgi:hypothetical protein
MTIRTIKQQGQLYGLGSATLIAKIDGAVVFNGTIDAVNQPFPSLPTSSLVGAVDLFSWEEEVSFAGTRTLEIYVTGATLLLADTLANYYNMSVDAVPPIPPRSTSSGPSDFGWVYLTNNNDTIITDPLSNVKIDGKLILQDRANELTGQWHWKVTSGSTLTATINIKAGSE